MTLGELHRYRWPIAIFSMSTGMLAIALTVACMTLYQTDRLERQGQSTTRLAEQTAQIVADYNKPAFAPGGTKLISISINGAPSFSPDARALYVHQCDMISLLRYATVREDGNYLIGKAYSWAEDDGGLNLTPGMEFFSVKKNPNQMRPVFKVPSNLPHHLYLSYLTSAQYLRRPTPAQPMQTIIFYILDHNEAIPKPPQRVKAMLGSPDHDNPLECPALTVPLSPVPALP